MTNPNLAQRHCKPCEGNVPPMDKEEIEEMLQKLQGWEYRKGKICKTYKFKNFYQSMAFANAIAWVAHQENHHPVLKIAFNTCEVRYFTQAIQGISENDFICCAKIDALAFPPELPQKESKKEGTEPKSGHEKKGSDRKNKPDEKQ